MEFSHDRGDLAANLATVGIESIDVYIHHSRMKSSNIICAALLTLTTTSVDLTHRYDDTH